MDTERCAACGKVFTPRARPHWAFTLEGRPAGKIHAAVCVTGRNRRFLSVGHRGVTQDRAQFDIWLMHLRPRPEQNTDAWRAYLLAEEPTEALSERQERYLDVLRARKQDSLPPERVVAIREAHTALIREFRTWQARPEMAPNGCS